MLIATYSLSANSSSTRFGDVRKYNIMQLVSCAYNSQFNETRSSAIAETPRVPRVVEYFG